MLVGMPAGRCIMAGMDQRRVPSFRAENCGKSAVAVHQQGRLPSLGAEADSHGVIPLLPYTRWSMSLLRWSGRFLFLAATCTYLLFACGVQDLDFLGDPRNVPYSALLGSTVDTCSASVYEAFWAKF